MPTTLRLTFQPYGTVPATTIEVLSISVDALQTLNIGSQSTGAGAGRITFNPFTLTRHPDTFSPTLFAMCCSGTPFHKVTLEVTPAFTFTMGLAAVKTIAFTSTDAEGHLLETISLEYGQAAISITPQNPDGSLGKPVATAWDRVKNISADPTKLGIL